ncbi:MAG TPA: hypothetical protein VGW38_28785, partial [Chloroflexota bacterium]|nr:hypothetical protein [Chloroflexota bacterium]
MNPPILVLTRDASLSPFASYLPELLRMEGLNWLSVQECSSLDGDVPLSPLVVLGAVDLDRREAEILASHVRQGGALLAARPSPALMTAFDLPPAQPLPGGWSRGYVVLEEASPVVAGLPWPVGGVQYFSHTLALQVGSGEPGSSGVSSRAPNPSGARGERVAAAAWLAPFSGQPTRFPALVTLPFGAGRVVLVAYDPAECAVVQQQGRPQQASTGALPDFDGDGTFRPNDLFLGQLDPALRDVPQADLQRTLLLRAIEWLTEHQPLPRLWRFPNNAPAAIFLDGDSDNMRQEDFDLAIQTCDRYNAPFATYLKTEHINMLQASDERAARARGHRFGLHPWAGPKPSVEEFHGVVQHDSAQFAARYGYRPRVMRSHWVVWPGWVDTARTLQAAGIQLDTNFTAGWGFKGGYVNGSGLPARFVNEAGVLLDLYEQSTISGDDSWLLPKAG